MSAKSSDKKSSDKRPSPAEGALTTAAGRGERARSGDGRSPEPDPEKGGPDVAIVCGVSGDGQGVDIIRKRGERIEAGTVRPLEHGKPIHGEVVRLLPRDNFPMICDVEVELPAPGQPQASPPTSGPAQVATETYRKNWDAIYGRSRKPRPLLN